MKRSPMPPRKAPLRRVSMKRLRQRRERARINAEAKARAGGRCEVRSPVCWGWGHAAHEIWSRGRYPGSHVDGTPKVWACNPCNEYVQSHSMWAEEHGWLVPSGLERRS